MIDDTHLDGNAIGGLMLEMFGRDMTGELGCCGDCGAISPLGAVHVYGRAPGTVLRCPACTNVLMVIARVDESYRLTFEGIAWIRTSTTQS